MSKVETFKARESKINDFINKNKLFKYCSNDGLVEPPPEGRKVLVQTKDGDTLVAVCNQGTWYLPSQEVLDYNEVLAWIPVPRFHGPRSRLHKLEKEKGARNDDTSNTKQDNPRSHNSRSGRDYNHRNPDPCNYGLHGFHGGFNRERSFEKEVGPSPDEGLHLRQRNEVAGVVRKNRSANRQR